MNDLIIIGMALTGWCGFLIMLGRARYYHEKLEHAEMEIFCLISICKRDCHADHVKTKLKSIEYHLKDYKFNNEFLGYKCRGFKNKG